MSLTKEEQERFKKMTPKQLWDYILSVLVVFIGKTKYASNKMDEVRAETEEYVAEIKKRMLSL